MGARAGYATKQLSESSKLFSPAEHGCSQGIVLQATRSQKPRPATIVDVEQLVDHSLEARTIKAHFDYTYKLDEGTRTHIQTVTTTNLLLLC